jgi:sialate O-acetylesterase
MGFGALSALAAVASEAARPPEPLRLAPILTDGAVLQRGQRLPIWGTATPGATVQVEFGDVVRETQTDLAGRWRVERPVQSANVEPRTLHVRSGGRELTRRGLRVGDVWICAGQSNIEWPVALAAEAGAARARAGSAAVSHFHVARKPSNTPLEPEAREAGWAEATAENVGDFSAVGFFFAEEMARWAHVPLGVITVAWGGTPIESWLSAASLRRSRAWPDFSRRWEQALAEFPARQRDYPELDRAWRAADEHSRRTGEPNPLPWPQPPVGPGTAYAPGALFDGMVLPLADFPVRGVVWYQGESNVSRASEYTELLAALVADWRTAWGAPTLPFVVVQLPNYADHNAAGTAWAELREAQAAAVRATPGTILVSTVDLGDAADLHPRAKLALGRRVAAEAAHAWLGAATAPRTPVPHALTVEGNRVLVEFAPAATLRLEPATGKAPFELAGEDRQFFAAEARLTGRRVELSSPRVPEPRYVRYAWANQPAALLVDEHGAAAGPFVRQLGR